MSNNIIDLNKCNNIELVTDFNLTICDTLYKVKTEQGEVKYLGVKGKKRYSISIEEMGPGKIAYLYTEMK